MGKSRQDPETLRLNRAVVKHQVAWNGGGEGDSTSHKIAGADFIQKVGDGLKEASRRFSRLGKMPDAPAAPAAPSRRFVNATDDQLRAAQKKLSDRGRR